MNPVIPIQTSNQLLVNGHRGFEDCVVTGDAETDITLSDKRRDVRGGKEHPVSTDQR